MADKQTDSDPAVTLASVHKEMTADPKTGDDKPPDKDKAKSDEKYLALDDESLKGMSDAAKKRYGEQTEGVQKKERQIAEREAALETDASELKELRAKKDDFAELQKFKDMIADPEKGKAYIVDLYNRATGDAVKPFESEYESEKKLAEYGDRKLSATEQRLKAEIAAIRAEFADQIGKHDKDLTARDATSALEVRIDEALPKLKGMSEILGREVERKDVAKAVKEYPSLTDEQAMRLTHFDEIQKLSNGKATRSEPKKPEMIPGTGKQGSTPPPKTTDLAKIHAWMKQPGEI